MCHSGALLYKNLLSAANVFFGLAKIQTLQKGVEQIQQITARNSALLDDQEFLHCDSTLDQTVMCMVDAAASALLESNSKCKKFKKQQWQEQVLLATILLGRMYLKQAGKQSCCVKNMYATSSVSCLSVAMQRVWSQDHTHLGSAIVIVGLLPVILFVQSPALHICQHYRFFLPVQNAADELSHV